MSNGNYLEKVRKSESGNKDTAVNPMGGASGRYQFVKSTWEGLGYDWKDRFNPQLQEEAMAKYTNQTRNQFVNTFKTEPSDADLYGMHFLGSGTYIKALKSGDNTPITDIVSKKAYDYNKGVMSKNGKPITVGELKGWLTSKMGNTTSQTPTSQESSEYVNYLAGIDTNLPQGGGIVFSGESEKEEEPQKTEGEKAAEAIKEENFLEDYAELQAQRQQQVQQPAYEQPIVAPLQVTPIEFAPPPLPQQQFEVGGIVKDDMGYWNPNNWGKPVEITSNRITMKGVNQPLIGVSNETGEKKLMMPNTEHYFKDTNSVTEYPIFKK